MRSLKQVSARAVAGAVFAHYRTAGHTAQAQLLQEPNEARQVRCTVARKAKEKDPVFHDRLRQHHKVSNRTGDYSFTMEAMYPSREILNVPIVSATYSGLVRDALDWAAHGDSKAICFATVHGIMEAHDDPGFRQMYASSDMLNADGMPLVWSLRLLGLPGAQRIYGPDATEHLLGAAERQGIPVGFYGASPPTLRALLATVHSRWPALHVSFAEAPPFRALTAQEEEATDLRMRNAGVRFVFVGLGCPRQEAWVVRHRGRIPAVLFAVGAAFDFLAGTKPQAPRWMMGLGLEWLFRLLCEPRRMFKRYFKHNGRFLYLFGMQWLRYRLRRPALLSAARTAAPMPSPAAVPGIEGKPSPK